MSRRLEQQQLESILRQVQSGTLSIERAQQQITSFQIDTIATPQVSENSGLQERESGTAEFTQHNNPDDPDDLSHLADLGFAQLDLQREERTGFPEVIFGEGKTTAQIIEILMKMMEHTERVLATRISPEKAEQVIQTLPMLTYHESARALTWLKGSSSPIYEGYIAIVCAGTSDVPVAEEAAVTAECMGHRVERIYDVGVAGIHRLFRRLPLIRGANAIVVAAGMEGALASVMGGLVSKPIVAVPTSVGYGASFQGLTAMLSMLNSCAPGVSVVNIDNGFGAGYYASLINKTFQDQRIRRPL